MHLPDRHAQAEGHVHRVYTPHPTPYTLYPTPYTLHPIPYTLHPTPYTLHPTPYTLHLTPYTLHPTPSTLHPAAPLPRYLALPSVFLGYGTFGREGQGERERQEGASAAPCTPPDSGL